jgi:hypothetical protein
LQGESGGLEALGEAGDVVDPEFDLGFDRHLRSEYTAKLPGDARVRGERIGG